MPAESTPMFDPAPLIDMTGEPLRSVARRLGVDPAVLCRPLTSKQADRFAIKLGFHPGIVWGAAWWRPGKGPRAAA
jgi:hypothetical protein